MKIEKILCDRCKMEMHYPVDIERKIWLSGKGREGGLDLCDDCYNKMINWFMECYTNNNDCP